MVHPQNLSKHHFVANTNTHTHTLLALFCGQLNTLGYSGYSNVPMISPMESHDLLVAVPFIATLCYSSYSLKNDLKITRYSRDS